MGNWTRWTKGMDDYLRHRFRKIGDTKLAELFEKKFPKNHPWTKKHIEKRRWYLKLKRSKKEEHDLRVLNNKDGRQFKMWDTLGRSPEGTIKNWGSRTHIKVHGKFVDYHRHIAGAKPGDIVRHHEGDLRIIDRAENQRLNAKIRAARPSELKTTIKALNELKQLLLRMSYVRKSRG